MPYPFRHKYIQIVQNRISALEKKMVGIYTTHTQREDCKRAIGLLRRFLGYRNSLEEKLIMLEKRDSFLVGEALGQLVDDRLWEVWKRLEFGYFGNDPDIFSPLEEIEVFFLR